MRKLAYIFCISLFLFGCGTDFSKIGFPKVEEKVPGVKLGIMIQKITPDLAKLFSLKDNRGVLVGDVFSGSSAAKAGIKRGDVIVEYNGQQVSNNIEFFVRMVSQTTPNTNVGVVVIRDGKPISLDIDTQIRDFAKDIENYKKQVRQNPNDAEKHNLLGISYRDSGQHENAIASFKEAIRIKPGYADARSGLATTYREIAYHYYSLKQFSKAIAPYEEFLKIEPNNLEANHRSRSSEV